MSNDSTQRQIAEVVTFFGYGWLAKRLYEDAGIPLKELIA
jgi:hypothetical protein